MASYFDGTLGRQHADSPQEYYDHMEGDTHAVSGSLHGVLEPERELRLETTVAVLSFLQTMYLSVVYCAYVCRTRSLYEFALSIYYFNILPLSSTHDQNLGIRRPSRKLGIGRPSQKLGIGSTSRKLGIGRPRGLPKIRDRKALPKIRSQKASGLAFDGLEF